MIIIRLNYIHNYIHAIGPRTLPIRSSGYRDGRVVRLGALDISRSSGIQLDSACQSLTEPVVGSRKVISTTRNVTNLKCGPHRVVHCRESFTVH